ncbi:MAG: TIGR01777 family oxidoreductase [Desulfarculaceae bacterium]|nr:TIGR01777 family oxidoreductase [Desulfarculaceae bacterium]
MSVSIFEKESRLKVPVEKLFQWHERQGAIERLTPPWAQVKLVRHSGGIKKGARVRFRLAFVKIPFQWEAEHVDYQKNRLFRDRQVRGPFADWIHTHLFFPDGEDAAFMKDRIEFQLPFDVPGRPLHRLAQKELERMFAYRHRVLKNDLEAHARSLKRLNVLVSGGSGVIGSQLVPYLRAGGHRVIRLVRRRPAPGSDEMYWDPGKGELDLEGAGPIDAVINLNGANIARRWTPSGKREILASRVNPTLLLARKIAELDTKPSVFLTSSAVGFYGDREDEMITEDAPKASGFMSKVCTDWEKAAMPAVDAGVRTCFLRIGVVLTPAGGALARMVPFYKAGLGGRIGDGKQAMSWISMDDTLGAVHHALFDDRLSGPVNLTAPAPVTNRVFARSLSTVLSRPGRIRVPERLVKLLWGEMGYEVLLSGAAVMPEKLLATEYRFIHSHLDDALSHVLGRPAVDSAGV